MARRKITDYLTLGNLTAAVFALWVLAQFVVVIRYLGEPQYGDANNYLSFAAQAAAAGSWYPTAEMFNNNLWVANTGYINLLVLNLKLFGTTVAVGFEQIILNVVLVLSLRTVIRRLFNTTAANIATILFCLIPSNVEAVATYMSDIPSISLLVLSLALLKPDWRMVVLSGFILGIANWLRPVALLYGPSLLIYAIVRKTDYKYYFAYVGGLAVAVIGIATLTYTSSGYPLTGSTTKGTNMIIGCWDGAKGNYDDEVFLPGNPGYIDPELGYNAAQKDSCLTSRSVRWIIEEPTTFAKLVPAKMVYLWGHNCYAYKILTPESKRSFMYMALYSIPYYLVLIMALLGLWQERRRIFGLTGIVILPVVLGCLMHLLMYGAARYHYPMLPPLICLAALWLASRPIFSRDL